MSEDQKELISQQETTGTGDLYRGVEYLGKCEYRLKIRRSRLKIKKSWPNRDEQEREYVITTIIGALILGCEPGEADHENHAALILHLNDDYLVPLSATHIDSDGHTCKVYGHLVVETGGIFNGS